MKLIFKQICRIIILVDFTNDTHTNESILSATIPGHTHAHAHTFTHTQPYDFMITFHYLIKTDDNQLNQHFINKTSFRIFIILDELSTLTSATQFCERSNKKSLNNLKA